MQDDNLWPANLEVPDVPTPGFILRQQAKGLGERTAGLVDGEVTTVIKDGQFLHRFYARTPLLDYRLVLFEVRHGIDPYRATIVWPKGFAGPREVDGPDELRGVLKEIFNHDTTRKTIGQLQAYTRDQGLPYTLVEDGEVIGQAKTLALALRKAREVISRDSEIIIYRKGSEMGSVRSNAGNITEDLVQPVPTS